VIDSLTGQGINVPHTCQTLGISESGYYACKDRPDPPRTLRRIWLAGEIADIHKASGSTYLAHRVTAELRYGRSILGGDNAVESIMRELGRLICPLSGLHVSNPGTARLRGASSTCCDG